MASYFRSWLSYGGTHQNPTTHTPIPEFEFNRVSPPPDASDDDTPPAFPALSSIQRSNAASSSPRSSFDSGRGRKSDAEMMPPPAFPLRSSQSATSNSTTLSGNLDLPPTTTKPLPNVNKKAKARAKVALAPGHGALDWARLKSSGEDLRAGVTTLLRITPSELKEHRTVDDAWSAFNGKVYNITPYMQYHPGGEKELMRVAGRDGTKLFALTHSWVNLDFMLDGCMVGFLVAEHS